MIVYLNGSYLDESDAALSIADRGLLFGDGVFETALVHDGGFFRLTPHLDRFAASAALMRIPVPPIAEIDRITRAVVRENGLPRATVRITLTRGTGRPTLLVTARPPDLSWVDRARRGWTLVTARTRRPSVAALPAQLKALGRIHSLLARHEATDAGADDALLLTDDGHVCEGASWNVFWRIGSELFTPSLDAGVLAGITRSVLLDLATAAGFTPHEGIWPRPVLDQAEEIFATMTSVGIVPIRSLDGRMLPAATPAAEVLQERYWQLVEREAAADPV